MSHPSYWTFSTAADSDEDDYDDEEGYEPSMSLWILFQSLEIQEERIEPEVRISEDPKE